ncbi:MAG: YcfL family protein [Planctomycetota bacterium]
MKRSLRLLLLAPLALLVACNTTNTVEPADAKAVPTVLEDRRVITNNALNAKAYVTDLREADLPNGLRKVQAGLYNKTSSRQRINYKFEWFDTDGIVVNAATNPWQTISINGRETVYITAVSPTANAVDFQVKLLESRN